MKFIYTSSIIYTVVATFAANMVSALSDAGSVSDIAGCDSICQAHRAAGNQFVTGLCATSSECAAKCCQKKSGQCRNVLAIGDAVTGQAQCIDNETGQLSGGGESGSGSGSGSTSSQSGSSSSSNSNVQGTPQHPTFITGTCEFSDGCNSGCCGFKSGLCAGNIIAQTRDGGCRKKSDGTPSGFNTPENAAKIDGAAGAGGSSTSASTTTTTVAATTSPTTATTVASADCDASCVARRKAGSAFIFDPCSTSSECGAKCCSGGKCRNVLAIATNDPVTGRFDPASGQRKCVGNENGQL